MMRCASVYRSFAQPSSRARSTYWQAADHVSRCPGNRSYHVAVIGSGPGGFYTSKYLMKLGADKNVQVDMFERLPVPYGLVRFGVAPDHPEVKNVINDFADVANTSQFRFFGNVEVGKHVSLETLERAYDAVVVCTGAQGERKLGIPGEDLAGVVGAPSFVYWYNGHPDYRELDIPEPGDTAVVLGQGNVALDIARILTKPPADLQSTDIDQEALNRIGRWQKNGLREVQVVGRRGFVQAAFTNKELREQLTASDDVLAIIDPEEFALCRNPASEVELGTSRMKKRSLEILDKMANNFADRHTTSKRVVWFRFLQAPTEVLSDGHGAVKGISLQRTQLKGEAGKQWAEPADSGATEDVNCGMVIRSVGFDLTMMDGLPLDGSRRIPHTHGRVSAPDRHLYVSGWSKRGPNGVIATNIPDAQETSKQILHDLALVDSRADLSLVESALADTGARVVPFSGVERLLAEELSRGTASGRAAVKFTNVADMMNLVEAKQ